MSKEMMIVFVYDTECCQDEADDPVSAVLYFHPSWVSDVQKISLVGQLMGTAHFLRDTFAARPAVISLQSGRFVLQEFGRFLLAVGTDRNMPGSTLQHRADVLTSLVRFFHRDIQTMHAQFSSGSGASNNGTTSGDSSEQQPPSLLSQQQQQPYKSLSDKLYHIFETYLPILQQNGNVFQNLPISRLPKSASNIFLDAMQTLQSCQQTKGVLGGSIFFHNKVLATQLTPELTKNLVLTDPYRIKSTAESVTVQFHIPVGVQLITIYIPSADHRRLRVEAQRAQTVIGTAANGGRATDAPSTPAGIIPFQFKKKMKRDKSIIFTNIPEEAAVVTAEEAVEEVADAPMATTTTTTTAPPAAPPAAKPRPNHLPLRFKNITSKDLPESGFSSINFDESDSFPQFIGKTSVCSTPMTELKLLHGPVLSICNDTVVATTKPSAQFSADGFYINPPSDSPKKHAATALPLEPIVHITTDDIPPPPAFGAYANNDSATFKMTTRRHSLSNVQESLKKIRLAMRPIGSGLAKLGRQFQADQAATSGQMDVQFGNGDEDDDDDDDVDDVERRTYRTITDPLYPVFNSSGAPISKCLFQEYLAANGIGVEDEKPKTMVDESQNICSENGGGVAQDLADPLNIAGFDGKIIDSRLAETAAADGAPDEVDSLTAAPVSGAKLPAITPNRTALSLPLKSLTLDLVNTTATGAASSTTANGGGTGSSAAAASGGNMFEVPAQRRKLTGIQLTPLMTKLSILAMADERSSGFSSWDTTPGCGLDMVATPAGYESGRPFRRRSSATSASRYEDLVEFEEETEEAAAAAMANVNGAKKKKPDDAESAADGMTRCELFVCGQQNMTMLLVLEEAAGQRQELVQTMFETCVSRLTRIEASLSQTLNVNVDSDKADGAAALYSFLSTDPHWDTLQRGGPWAAGDLVTLEHMRSDLQRTGDGRTDMVLRTDDAVVYGYQHGMSSVFYKQTAALKPGLPPPADAMGVISMNAKRRLERDHSIVLL